MADIPKLSMIGTNKFEDDPIGAVYPEAPDFVVLGMQFFSSQGRIKRVALEDVCFVYSLTLYRFGQFLKQPIESGRCGDFKHDSLGHQFAEGFSFGDPLGLMILLRSVQGLQKFFVVQTNRITKGFIVFFCNFDLNGTPCGFQFSFQGLGHWFFLSGIYPSLLTKFGKVKSAAVTGLRIVQDKNDLNKSFVSKRNREGSSPLLTIHAEPGVDTPRDLLLAQDNRHIVQGCRLKYLRSFPQEDVQSFPSRHNQSIRQPAACFHPLQFVALYESWPYLILSLANFLNSVQISLYGSTQRMRAKDVPTHFLAFSSMPAHRSNTGKAPYFNYDFPFSVFLATGLSMILLLFLANFPASAATRTDRATIDGPLAMTQSLDEELLYLQEEKVVTAVRHEQPISESPSNIYVITAEDIRQSGATDIPTILRRVPGMEVMQTNGSEFNVSVRGNNQLFANKLLVLVDGRSIYEDGQALVYWKLIPVTLPEIQRIEVLKGPVSAVYGFNAFDGVINIITKSPEEMKGTTIQVGGGEFGTVSSAAIHAGVHGQLRYRLSAGWEQNQEWRNRNALGFHASKFNVFGEYTIGDSLLRMSGGLVDSTHLVTTSRVSTTGTDPNQAYVQVVYERPTFLVQAWWSETNTSQASKTHPFLANLIQVGLDPTLTPNTTFRGNTFNLVTQHQLEPSHTHRLTYGVNYRRNTIDSKIHSGFNREDRLGFYLQDEWHSTQVITTVAGLRLDLHSEINPTYSPRVAVIYKPTHGHTLRTTISIAYRQPTLAETNLDVRTVTMLPAPIPPSPPTTTVGSPNLKPEQIISYDVGYQGWFFRHRLRLRADVFFNHISDLINFSGDGIAVNSPAVDIWGGEAGIEFLPIHWLTGFANYAYQDIGQAIQGINRRAAPRFKINGGLRGMWNNGFSGEVTVYFVGANTVPITEAFTSFIPFGSTAPNPRVRSFTLVNLRGAYQFWNKQAEVAISVFNALNDRHKEHPLGDTIGSRVMGWLTVQLPAGTFNPLPF